MRILQSILNLRDVCNLLHNVDAGSEITYIMCTGEQRSCLGRQSRYDLRIKRIDKYAAWVGKGA